MPTDTQVICSEAPIALVVADHGIYPLTMCCQAVATASDGGIYCKKCYENVADYFGDCWQLNEERGWTTYKYLVELAVQVEQLVTVGRTDPGASDAKADEVVAYARGVAAGVYAQG